MTQTNVRDGAPTDATIPRLPFIEGLRGIAAAVVALGHLLYVTPAFDAGFGTSIRSLRGAHILGWPLRFGFQMVILFLLVSGFALAYAELVRGSRGQTSTAARVFFLRRAWRIGPIYYLAVAWGLIVFLIPWGQPRRGGELIANFPITWQGTLAHLGFVHNLHPTAWSLQANGPLWSMAYEVQLYLVFPLAFLVLRRTAGWRAWLLVLVLFCAASVIPADGSVLARAFVLGIALAVAADTWRWVPSWTLITAGLGLLAIGLLDLRHVVLDKNLFSLVWLGAFGLLVLAAMRSPAHRLNPANARPARWLGERSYSLYALHYPLAYLLFAGFSAVGLSERAVSVATLLAGIPLSLLLASAAYRWVEVPSLRRARAI